MSIRYVITGDNGIVEGQRQIFTIYDSKHPNAHPGITKSNHRACIRDRMFTGEYTFVLSSLHAGYEKISSRKTIITIRDIDEERVQTEDEMIVFRGDVTEISEDDWGRRTFRCQPDIQWLSDVPDVFSRIVDNDTVYYIGVDDGVVELWFKAQNGAAHGGRAIYGSYDRNNTISLRNMWADYQFRPKLAGSVFDVEMPTGTDTEAIGLRKFTITRENNPAYPITVLYIGNVELLYAQTNVPKIGSTDPFTVMEYDLYERMVITDSPTGQILGHLRIPPLSEVKNAETPIHGETETPLADMNFCIAHYYDPLLGEYTAGEFMGRGRNYSKVYTTITPPWPPSETSSIPTIPVQVSRTQRTTVEAMVSSDFNPYRTKTGEIAAQKGYNLMCDEERRIYRGNIDVNGELDHSGIDTIYSNLSAWTKAAGGFVRIRHETVAGGIGAFVDLMRESGVYSYGFSVVAGYNLVKFSKEEEVSGLYTAIYPRGVYNDGRTPVTFQGADMSGVELLRQYEVNSDNGLLYNSVATGLYGRIVLCQDYAMDSVPAGTELQYMYDNASRDLQSLIEAFVSFEISAIDRRLLRRDDAERPVLGNYYSVQQRLGPQMMQLSEINTDHIKPGASKLAFGTRINILSDFVAREVKR